MTPSDRRLVTALAALALALLVAVLLLGCSPTSGSLSSAPDPSPSLAGSVPATPAAPSASPTSPTVSPVAVQSPAAPPAGVVAGVAPLDGEGIIHLVTRVCGSSRSWTANAAANHIVPTSDPAWLVLASARLRIDCSLAPVPVPAVAPAPVVVQQTQRQAAAEWVSPLPGTCRPPTGGGQFGAPRNGYRHQGIDLGGIEGLRVGTPVHSPHAGVVSRRGYAGNAGNQVQIQSGEWLIKLNHLQGFAVGVGETVAAGQVVGYMGATGNASGPHVHVELWMSGRLVNPSTVLPVGCS